MKKIFLLFVCALNIATVHAKTKVFDDTPRIISLSELSFEKIQELIHSKDSEYIVEFKEGTMVPIQFLTKNRFLSAMIDPNLTFKVEKTFYFRILNNKCYMSENLVQWEKTSKFLGGKRTVLIKPIEKGGLMLETTLTPHEKSEIKEESN